MTTFIVHTFKEVFAVEAGKVYIEPVGEGGGCLVFFRDTDGDDEDDEEGVIATWAAGEWTSAYEEGTVRPYVPDVAKADQPVDSWATQATEALNRLRGAT